MATLLRTFFMPMIVGKTLILYFGLNYAEHRGEGYGYGLALSMAFTATMLILFIYKNFNNPDL